MVVAGFANTGYLGLPFSAALFGLDELPERGGLRRGGDHARDLHDRLLHRRGVRHRRATGPASAPAAFFARNPPLWACAAGFLAPGGAGARVGGGRGAAAGVRDAAAGLLRGGRDAGAGGRRRRPACSLRPWTPRWAPRWGCACWWRPRVVVALSALVLEVPDSYLSQAAMASAINAIVVAHQYGLDRGARGRRDRVVDRRSWSSRGWRWRCCRFPRRDAPRQPRRADVRRRAAAGAAALRPLGRGAGRALPGGRRRDRVRRGPGRRRARSPGSRSAPGAAAPTCPAPRRPPRATSCSATCPTPASTRARRPRRFEAVVDYTDETADGQPGVDAGPLRPGDRPLARAGGPARGGDARLGRVAGGQRRGGHHRARARPPPTSASCWTTASRWSRSTPTRATTWRCGCSAARGAELAKESLYEDDEEDEGPEALPPSGGLWLSCRFRSARLDSDTAAGRPRSSPVATGAATRLQSRRSGRSGPASTRR